MSFLVWRALRQKLPTNDKMITFGIEPAKCFCCIKQGWDDMNHIFTNGHFAAHFWNFRAGLWGIIYQQTHLKHLLLNWESDNHRNEIHRNITQSLPIVVCWNLWNNRCSAKYGWKKSSISRVKYLILAKRYSHIFNYIYAKSF